MTATYTEAEATRIADDLNAAKAAKGDRTWKYASVREGETDRYIVGAFDAGGILVGSVAGAAGYRAIIT